MKKLSAVALMIGFIITILTISISADKNETKVDELIKQLDNDDCQKREDTQKELTEYGTTLIEQYRKAKSTIEAPRLGRDSAVATQKTQSKDKIENFAQSLTKGTKSKDPEIKMRVNQIRQHFYSYLMQSKIAFAAQQDINGPRPQVIYKVIYTMDADGNNQTRVTENKDNSLFPAWNSNGTKIAFLSYRLSVSLYDGGGIYVMDTDGKNQTRLTTADQKRLGCPTWSPDGTKIAFVAELLPLHALYVMDADGKNQIRLATMTKEYPAWSPDSAKIAFMAKQDGNWSICVIDANGKNQSRLTENKDYRYSSPVWNPDGTQIAFGSERDGKWALYVMNADGKNETRLTENIYENCNPAWSPDGTKIAFIAAKEVYVLDANGKNLTLLATNVVECPVWSPDSTKIAFMSYQNGGRVLYVIDKDGRHQTSLAENRVDVRDIAWSRALLPEIAALFAPLDLPDRQAGEKDKK